MPKIGGAAMTIIGLVIALYIAAFTLPGALTEWFNYTSTNTIVAALWFLPGIGIVIYLGLKFMGGR